MTDVCSVRSKAKRLSAHRVQCLSLNLNNVLFKKVGFCLRLAEGKTLFLPRSAFGGFVRRRRAYRGRFVRMLCQGSVGWGRSVQKSDRPCGGRTGVSGKWVGRGRAGWTGRAGRGRAGVSFGHGAGRAGRANLSDEVGRLYRAGGGRTGVGRFRSGGCRTGGSGKSVERGSGGWTGQAAWVRRVGRTGSFRRMPDGRDGRIGRTGGRAGVGRVSRAAAGRAGPAKRSVGRCRRPGGLVF